MGLFSKYLLNEGNFENLESQFKLQRKPDSWDSVPTQKYTELSDAAKETLSSLEVYQVNDIFGSDDLDKVGIGSEFVNPMDGPFAMDDGDGHNYIIDPQGYDYARYVARVYMDYEE